MTKTSQGGTAAGSLSGDDREAAVARVLWGKVLRYESGEMGRKEGLALFADLIKTGLCWRLQSHYGRTASHLIDEKWISPSGVILRTTDLTD